MHIRTAVKADYSAICSLINLELGYTSVNIEDLTLRMELMSQDANYLTFVALINDEVVGFIGTVQGIAFEVNGIYLRIIAMAVAKPHQNKGIGRSLLKHVEDFADSKSITIFAVNSGLQRLSTHAFYENNGFTKASYGFGKSKK
jgi:predicted N-acetyltransferase YhbS